jgi:hypothetical protein
MIGDRERLTIPFGGRKRQTRRCGADLQSFPRVLGKGRDRAQSLLSTQLLKSGIGIFRAGQGLNLAKEKKNP